MVLDDGDFCTMASTTVHVLAQSVVCLHCSHALVLTWLSEARQPSCSQYHEISPHPQGKLPALLKVAFNRLLKKKNYLFGCITSAGSLVEACGIEFPNQGSNLGPLQWESGVLATGPPGKSFNRLLLLVTNKIF